MILEVMTSTPPTFSLTRTLKTVSLGHVPSSASVFDLKDTVARADKSTDEHTHSRTTTGASLAKVARTLREKPREVGQGTKRTRREQDEVVGVEDEVNLEEKAQLLLLKASSP